MRLGLLTAILGDYTFKEAVEIAAKIGYESLEVACWPKGKGERRYAGVSHIDTENLTDEDIAAIKTLLKDHNMSISALAFYPNTMDADLEKRNAAIEHLKSVIVAAKRLDVNLVNTFIGRDSALSVEANLEIFKEVWPPIIRFAKEQGVKIAIENCPMLFDETQWPGGQNLFYSPALWRRIFEIIPDSNFGINFDPSHFVWQQLDYIAPLAEFKDRIFHVHFKDIHVDEKNLREEGVLAYPLSYMEPRLPGLGDVKWDQFLSALYAIGYDKDAVVEVEDRAFESTPQRVIDSCTLTYRYMRQFVI